MTQQELKNLKPGDLIKDVATLGNWVVTSNYDNRVIAVRTVHITNPSQWNLLTGPIKEVEIPMDCTCFFDKYGKVLNSVSSKSIVKAFYYHQRNERGKVHEALGLRLILKDEK